MSLRARLATVLAVVMLAPLTVAAVAVGVVVPRAARSAGENAVARDAGTAALALAARCQAVGDMAGMAARRIAATAVSRGVLDVDAAAIGVREAAASRPGVAIAVVDARGVVLTSAGTVLANAVQPGLGGAGAGVSCALGAPATGSVPLLGEEVPIRDAGRTVARVRAWAPLDRPALRQLQASLGLSAGLAVLTAGSSGGPARVATTTLPVAVPSPVLAASAAGRMTGTAGGYRYAVRDATPGVPYAVITLSEEGGTSLVTIAVGVLAAAALLAVLLVWMLARRLTGPLAGLTSVAERLRSGDLDARSGIQGNDEVGRLAVALDEMAENLQGRLGELQHSRDALSETFDRFGEALGRTHDLDGLLDTVVAAAVHAAGAALGVALLDDSSGATSTGTLDRAGDGVAMTERVRVVEDAAAVAVDAGTRALERLADRAVQRGDCVLEGYGPETGPAVALPLQAGNRMIGAVALARGRGAVPFDEGGLARVRALVSHAGTAIANVRVHEEARRLSVTDPLTGAGNMRQLSTTLSREVERATRFGRPLTVLMLDLDHFKQVNDTLGHAFGDDVLREFARRLEDCLREVDTVARYGGEEFTVILPETDVDGGTRVAERIIDAVRAEPFGPGELRRAVTVSVGVAAFPAHGRSVTEVLRSADSALYAAKRAGRDRWCVAGISPEAAAVSQAG